MDDEAGICGGNELKNNNLNKNFKTWKMNTAKA